MYSVCAFSCDVYQKPEWFIRISFELFRIINTSDFYRLIIESPLSELLSKINRSSNLLENGKKNTGIIKDMEGKIL